MNSNPFKAMATLPPMLEAAGMAGGQSIEFNAMANLRLMGSRPMHEVERQCHSRFVANWRLDRIFVAFRRNNLV